MEKEGTTESRGIADRKKKTKAERGPTTERWCSSRGWRRGEAGGEANSVKYPQLDATHWHTVSMQILFTLGVSFPLAVALSLSLPLVLTLSPSRFTWRAPLSSYPRPSHSSLAHNPSWKSEAMRDARVHTSPSPPRFTPRTFIPLPTLYLSLSLSLISRCDTSVVSPFIPISSSPFVADKRLDAKSRLHTPLEL